LNLEPHSELGHYRILDKLGEGGMGVVWKALDTRLDREVALKVLPSASAEVPGRLQRFEREARAVAALNHPNIVTLYSVEEESDVRFITMELVEGETLDRTIPAEGMTTERFFDVAIPLADALRAAHARGIVHRDLKPSNIMLDREGRLKILDFGLAKLRHEVEPETIETTAATTRSAVTQLGQAIGTVPYMSPEQVQGRPVDQRSDIFSAGIILYEMATGMRPFRGSSREEVVSSILRDSPPSVAEVNSTFPDGLGRIVGRCLEKQVDRRYPSVDELHEELRDAKGAGRRPNLRRLLPLAVAAVLLTLVALGVILLPREGGALSRPYTVAVLPFANLSGDPDKDYIAEGISSALIAQLGEVHGIRVLGRSAGLPDTRNSTLLQSAARKEGVDALLEGELQQAAGRIRVDAKLTSTESGLVMHSEDVHGDVEHVFVLQREIGYRFATILSIPITPDELRRLTREPTQSFEAYDYFLRGHQLLKGFANEEERGAAIELLRQAIRVDPEFAMAHIALSEALWRDYRHGGGKRSLDEAERAAERALEIDPGKPSALVAHARILNARGKHESSIEELEQALRAHPNPAEAQLELGRNYHAVGDLDEALRCFRAAVAIGGDDWFYHNELGAFLLEMGRGEEARAAWEEAARVAPPAVRTPEENLASLLVYEGRFSEAVRAFESLKGPVLDAILASNVATAFYFSDRPDRLTEAEEYYRLAVRLNPNDPEIRRNLADVCLELGRKEQATEHYREALRLTEETLRIHPEDPLVRLHRAHYAARAGECETAVSVARELIEELPAGGRSVHDLAYPFALCGEEREAIETIRRAIDLGYPAEVIRKETEFQGLSEHPEFQRLTDPDSATASRPPAR